jgi:hypothetical protein
MEFDEMCMRKLNSTLCAKLALLFAVVCVRQ